MITSDRKYSILVRIILLLSVLILSGVPASIGQASPPLTLRIEEDSSEADEAGFRGAERRAGNPPGKR